MKTGKRSDAPGHMGQGRGGGTGDRPDRECGMMVQELVATCDHFAARYAQQSLIRGDLELQVQRVSQQCEQLREGSEQLRGRLAMCDQERAELAVLVRELVASNDSFAELLERQRKEHSKMQVQLSYLQAQDQRYQRAIRRVTDTWYGKVMVKVYHAMRRMGLI